MRKAVIYLKVQSSLTTAIYRLYIYCIYQCRLMCSRQSFGTLTGCQHGAKLLVNIHHCPVQQQLSVCDFNRETRACSLSACSKQSSATVYSRQQTPPTVKQLVYRRHVNFSRKRQKIDGCQCCQKAARVQASTTRRSALRPLWPLAAAFFHCCSPCMHHLSTQPTRIRHICNSVLTTRTNKAQ